MLDNEKIGQLIAAKRKEAGYTQQQLAERLGVTNKAVSKWETGEGLPDISMFPVLGEVLGVSVDGLLRGTATETGGDLQPEKAPEADGAMLHRYQWERQIEKFKKRCLIAFFISVLGTICFGIVWLEQQDYYSFGIGFIAQALSICLFMGAYWSLRFEEKAYLRLYPMEGAGSKRLMMKFLCLLLIFWLIVPLIFLDIYTFWLIPWAHSSFMDIFFFLVGFAVLVFFFLHLSRKA